MGSFFAVNVQEIPYIAVALLFAFPAHEFAHAYTAYRLGDSTPKEQGRLTLEPHKHISLLGFVAFFIAGFGWAKPVQVNPMNFSHPKRDDILVSLAGPLANMLLVIAAFVLWYGAIALGLDRFLSNDNYQIADQFFITIAYTNIILFIFNLLPIPPLDGFHVFKNLVLGTDSRERVDAIENTLSLIALFIIISPIGDAILGPIFQSIAPDILRFWELVFTKLFGL